MLVGLADGALLAGPLVGSINDANAQEEGMMSTMRQYLAKSIGLASALVIAGCATVPDPHPIAGTTWKLVSIDTTGSSTTLTPELQQRHTVTFGDDGRVAMQLDCNRGNASWSGSMPRGGSGSLEIGPVASTRALCPDPSFGGQMARDLPEAARYRLLMEGRELVIETDRLRYSFASM